jgi:hypothetical protein
LLLRFMCAVLYAFVSSLVSVSVCATPSLPALPSTYLASNQEMQAYSTYCTYMCSPSAAVSHTQYLGLLATLPQQVSFIMPANRRWCIRPPFSYVQYVTYFTALFSAAFALPTGLHLCSNESLWPSLSLPLLLVSSTVLYSTLIVCVHRRCFVSVLCLLVALSASRHHFSCRSRFVVCTRDASACFTHVCAIRDRPLRYVDCFHFLRRINTSMLYVWAVIMFAHTLPL